MPRIRDREKFWARTLPFVLLAVALGIYALALAHPIDLTTADLGRHLRNGEQFFKNYSPLTTNFYSYTYPDFPVRNHHWGSGAVFYLLHQWLGFAGLQIAFILLGLLALILIFWTGFREGSPPWLVLGTVLALPLLAARFEIRPEIFSFLSVAIFLAVLFAYHRRTLSFRVVAVALFITEVLWVNLHLYFFLGPAITLAFFLEALLLKAERHRRRGLGVLFLLTVGATLLNPFGPQGAAEPFQIFGNYGYQLYENQSLWFLIRLFPRPLLFWTLALVGVSLLAAIWTSVRTKRLVGLFLALGFGSMAALQLRNISLFGLYFPLILAIFGREISAPLENSNSLMGLARYRQVLDRLALFVAAGLLALTTGVFLAGGAYLIFPHADQIRLGLKPGDARAAEFITREKISGPIFNNYDLGGYLIHYLYPREKVFVDNRPEAYPAQFFRDVYVPMQEEEGKWQEQDQKHAFNLIVFGYRDATPWSQAFLARRLPDKSWAPVFADDRVLILLRRTSANQSVIERFEVPAQNFRFSPAGG